MQINSLANMSVVSNKPLFSAFIVARYMYKDEKSSLNIEQTTL